MVNPKQKGNRFEREIANFLTRIFEISFLRVPMSGAFQTVNNTVSEVFSGDVFTEDEKYKDIVIECKNYKSISINDFFSDKSDFQKWIDQCIRESGKKFWVLFFKINRIGTFFVFDSSLLVDSNSMDFFKNVVKHSTSSKMIIVTPFMCVYKIKT